MNEPLFTQSHWQKLQSDYATCYTGMDNEGTQWMVFAGYVENDVHIDRA
jgi:hypothetical protein